MFEDSQKIAENIVRAAMDGGLKPEEAVDIVTQTVNTEVNCYPGFPGTECHPLAIFISLNGKLSRGKWPYTFEAILQELIKHVQGKCAAVTRRAVLITDSWWAPHFENWQFNLRQIAKDGVKLDIILINSTGSLNRIDLS